MAFPRIGGRGIPLSLSDQLTNAITLPAGQTYVIPSGTFYITPGPYTSIQWLDPVSETWRTVNGYSGMQVIDGDNYNWRLANLTGTPVGALITNAGTGLTNGFGTVVVTPSAGGSTWQSIVGGAVNATVTITTAGTGYNFPPNLQFSTPPISGVGGIQATGICAVTGGAITSVTVTNQGAGYTVPPTITVTPDPRDTLAQGAVLTTTLVGSGQLTALVLTGQGTPLTAAPTFTFNPASTIVAMAVMNFVVTGFTATTAGAGGGASQPFEVVFPPKLLAYVNRAANTAGPIADNNLTFPRAAWISGTTTAGGAITATGSVITDWGFGFQAVPEGYVLAGGTGLFTTAPLATATVGGVTDTSFIQPI
jgi:hypothetical protein